MNSDEKDRMHGEGDRESARKYNEGAHRFVKAGKAKQTGKTTNPPKADLDRAEHIGKKRAKEEDPAVSRDYKKPNR
ncbi:MAG: hypothetical protein M3436_00475 [Pseudomonadota bacterium]|nr:hypothetical protein [Pseudomonadota bacterium]